MAVISVPLNSRTRFTYPGSAPSLSWGQIRPDANADNLTALAMAVEPLQTAFVRDIYKIDEEELMEDDA